MPLCLPTGREYIKFKNYRKCGKLVECSFYREIIDINLHTFLEALMCKSIYNYYYIIFGVGWPGKFWHKRLTWEIIFYLFYACVVYILLS